MTESFDLTETNQVKRVAKRGAYDRETVFQVIDAAWIGHVGILNAHNGGVAVIPMLHARMDNYLIFHGANSSRLMKYLDSGQPVSVSFGIVDGLVLAKSLFHHSMNYRSVVVFGSGQLILDEAERLQALKAISDKIMPGRWDDARQPNEKELSATAVVKLKIESASAKIRTGDPIDEDFDLDLPVWSGTVPFRSSVDSPTPDSTSVGVAIPDYINAFQSQHNDSNSNPKNEVESSVRVGVPKPDEYHEYYHAYVSKANSKDFLKDFAAQPFELKKLLGNLEQGEDSRLHEPYTWTLKQVIGHLIDCERVFSTRMWRIAVGDTTPIPGIEQNMYVTNLDYENPNMTDLLEEFGDLRAANVRLVKRLRPESLANMGTASDNPVSAKANLYILAGHVVYHLDIIKRRLGV